MIVRPLDPLTQNRANLSSLPSQLALVARELQEVDGELKGRHKKIATSLGLGDDLQAVKSVMWMHKCALEQLRFQTTPICTDDEKKNLIKALDKLSYLEQKVLYHRYGLADGCPLTYRKMATLFYTDLSGRKQQAIQKHAAKAQTKLAQMMKMTIDQIDLILMSMTGSLPKKDFPVQVQDTYLRRSGPTKLTTLRDSLSRMSCGEVAEFLITLTPAMRKTLSLVIENPKDTAANLARKLQKPKQSIRNAKTALDIQLTSIQKRLDNWIKLKSSDEDQLQTTYSDDLITGIRCLLAEVDPEQIASISEHLTPYQQGIFNLFTSPACDTASSTEEINGASATKHITGENKTLYLKLKGLMHSEAKAINPPNALRALKRRIERILEDRPLKASQHSPQLEKLRAQVQDDPSVLDTLDELDAEIIKLRLQGPITNQEIAEHLSNVTGQDINTNFVERRVAHVYSTLGIPSERVSTTKDRPAHSEKLEQLQAHITANPGILEEFSLIDRQIIDFRSGNNRNKMTNGQVAEELTRLGNSANISLVERRLTVLYRKFNVS